MSTVMFVCTGNICRSPMAEGLFRHRLATSNLQHQHHTFSAGVWGLDGHPASDHAITVMAERGVDIGDHIAHTITFQDMGKADLILVMSGEHSRMLRDTWSQYSWKIHRLSEMVGKRQDIKDPYGGRIEEYRACADTISGYIARGFERILELA